MAAEHEFWARYDDLERRLTRPFTERFLDLAGLAPGMSVLDVATGRGEPAIPAAQRVAPTGRVIGVDKDESMLTMARNRADSEGVTNLELRVADAETLPGIPDGWADVALVRWGLMYLSSPRACLLAIRRALRDRGPLVLSVWVEPERVEYVSFPRSIRARYVHSPPIDLDAPGTFYYADRMRLATDLAAAGFAVEVTEEHRVSIVETGTPDELVEWICAFGEARWMRTVSEEHRRDWRAALIRQTEELRHGDAYRLGGVTRLVVARKG